MAHTKGGGMNFNNKHKFNDQRRRTLKHMAAGAGALSLARAGIATAQQDTLKIGVIYPLSGTIAQLGNNQLAGARVAAEQFNRAGGVLGRKVELVVRDDKASPAESALVGRELMGAGIKFFVGGLLTAPGMAIVNLLQENNALFVLTGSQIVALTHENFNPNAFRATINGRMNLYAAGSAVPLNNPQISQWGGITPDNQFGTDNYRLFSTALKKTYQSKLGKAVTTADPVLAPFPATDFKVQISRLMSSPIEGLYVGVVGADFVTFMAQAKQLGLYNKIKVFVEAGTGVAAARALGANLPKDNMWSPTSWYPGATNSAVSKALVKDYTEMTKDPLPDNSVYLGHMGMLAMLNAIKNANSLETPVVRVALERVEFESANGPFRFRREDHQGITNIQVLKLKQKEGDPGWEVSKVVTVRGEDVIEPPSPGQKYSET